MQAVIDFMKGIQPRGRFAYFLQNFIISCCAGLLKKITGGVLSINLLILMLSVPFYFVVTRGRIIDIERGMRRKTLLTEIWCVIVTIGVLFLHYVVKNNPDITQKPVIKFGVVDGIFALFVLVTSSALMIYLQFKRGEKAIVAEKKSQARMAEEASWDDSLKEKKPAEHEK